ncbi:NAD(P)H-dependent oxidoreductase [Cupriavidus basilensis]|uniref:FMN dependent NADH:quinone oxidoreductase n=1 Tax=Cupriavidus basilensis TaxID=68895 RepID=A0ABT6AG78_9BURK|nr:NAD(P)H-dependent oxidoreductase [Cupriavidus basilensis]MDF3831604.1 NAD(P)H-dependent oxidoreductase [Cupriavidus basilensis]
MKILRVSCSNRGQASESFRLSQAIVEGLLGGEPHASLIERNLGGMPIAHIDTGYAVALASATEEYEGVVAGTLEVSEALIRELEESDCLIIATPLHNYTVPSVLKAWIDHIVRVRRTFRSTQTGKVGVLRDRPVYVAVSSGGRFSGEAAGQPDFLTPYLRAILETIGLRSTHFFTVEGTAFGPDALAEARRAAQHALAGYFA